MKPNYSNSNYELKKNGDFDLELRTDNFGKKKFPQI